MPPTIISICGNIGCGKTTLLNLLHDVDGFHCMLEGIKDWGDILELSYSNPEKYSLAFQLRIISEQTLQKEAIMKMNEENVFIERSSDDGRYVFVNAKKKLSHLDDVMIAEFDRWVNIHGMGIHPDKIVYLRTTPEVAAKRIKERQQAGDSFVDMEYLQMLHELYDQRYLSDPNVLILEGFTAQENAEKVKEWLNKIEN